MLESKKHNEEMQLNVDLKILQQTGFNETSKIELQISRRYGRIRPQREMQATLDRWL